MKRVFLVRKTCRTNLTLFLPCCVSWNKTHRHISFWFFCLNMWLWCSFSCRFSFWKSFGRFSRHYKMRKILSAFFNVFSLHLFGFLAFSLCIFLFWLFYLFCFMNLMWNGLQFFEITHARIPYNGTGNKL